MDQKGVLSVDLLLATLILLIVIGSLVGFVSQSVDVAESSDVAQAQALSDTIARSINSVYTDGDGSYLYITLPNDFDYESVQVDQGVVYVLVGSSLVSDRNSAGYSFNATLIPSVSIINFPNDGLIRGQTYKVSNKNNIVDVEVITVNN